MKINQRNEPSPTSSRNREDSPTDLRAALTAIRERFEEASRECAALLQECSELREDARREVFETVFSEVLERAANLESGLDTHARRLEETGAPAEPTRTGGMAAQPGSAGRAPRPGARENEPGPPPAPDRPGTETALPSHENTPRPADGGIGHDRPRGERKAELESKLDTLIQLVSKHLTTGEHAPASGGPVPADLSYRIAREVVSRLKESAPLSAVLAPRSGAPGEREAASAAGTRRISLDDISAMIDTITGQD